MSQQQMDIPIMLEEKHLLPSYESFGASGADIKANLKEPINIQPGSSQLIPTGIKVAIPEGFELQVRPRSGLALKNQITVLNTPGTIDADYRGEVGVIIINHGRSTFTLTPGMRIAQLVLTPVYQANFTPCKDLNSTVRGRYGFGHTGTV